MELCTRDEHTKESEKERRVSYDMTDMWNLKCDTRDLFTKQKQKVCRRSKHSSLPKGKGWVGIHLQFGISTYRLLYMK